MESDPAEAKVDDCSEHILSVSEWRPGSATCTYGHESGLFIDLIKQTDLLLIYMEGMVDFLDVFREDSVEL